MAANADLVVICSYPLSSVGILLVANELNFTPKMLGGAMVGLQSTVFKDKLKSKLNGIVNYETWVPSPKLLAPAADFFKVYQERAKAAGTDPLGYYLGGWGYAYFQVLGEAIEGAKTLNDEKLADYMHSHEFKTIMVPAVRPKASLGLGVRKDQLTGFLVLRCEYGLITHAAPRFQIRCIGDAVILHLQRRLLGPLAVRTEGDVAQPRTSPRIDRRCDPSWRGNLDPARGARGTYRYTA